MGKLDQASWDKDGVGLKQKNIKEFFSTAKDDEGRLGITRRR